uniref:Hepatoma-derived growth factor n=1 Tax=Cacopsylla melanoneura TaxID=428564 RepID=A0A8D9BI23_9HEMI
MPAVERKFKTNDKVFAKVRGYPPWPARVEGMADETPNRLKYHIFFYGTRETGVCRQDELFPYSEFKEKYGKGVKRKFFTEALQEIECDFGTPKTRVLPPASTPKSEPSETQGSDNDDNNLVIDEGTEKKKSKTSTSRVSEAMDVDTPNYHHKPSPVVKVTTSGRKIKPKKTFDPDDTDSFSSPSGGFKEQDPIPGTDNALIKASVCRVKTLDGKLVILDINKFTPPENCKTEKSINLWKMNKINEFKQVREKIEEGETVTEEYQKLIDEQCQPEVQDKLEANEKALKTQLKLEVCILDIDLRIKDSIGLEHSDCDECLKALDDLINIPITPLMLKKHPEIVDTCRRLQRYTGNTAEWTMTEEEAEVFEQKASQVRTKADHVYNKLKNLFTVPAGETFWDIFSKQLVTFNDVTRNMPAHDLFSLCEDPTTQAS